MATSTRHGFVAASPEAVWEVITDAYSLPRWWPRVTRVENVTETGFTEVLYSRRGRPVRLDLRYAEVQEAAVLGWELDLPGSQFERLLAEWSTRLELAREAEGTRVTITERQSFRGSFRTGSFIQRRAAAKRISGALSALADQF